MKLENRFEVPRPPAETWTILLDVQKVVECVPGAELTSDEGDGRYKGTVAVRLGPVALKFNGTAALKDVDEANRSLSIQANGNDQKGRGSAGATSRVNVHPGEVGSVVVVETDIQLSGLVAQYGRASGVIKAVADEIVTQFANCLRSRLSDEKGRVDGGAPGAQPRAGTRDAARGNSPLGAALLLRALATWLRRLVSRG